MAGPTGRSGNIDDFDFKEFVLFDVVMQTNRDPDTRDQVAIIRNEDGFYLSTIARDIVKAEQKEARRRSKGPRKVYSNETLKKLMLDVELSLWPCGFCGSSELLATDDMLACQGCGTTFGIDWVLRELEREHPRVRTVPLNENISYGQ